MGAASKVAGKAGKRIKKEAAGELEKFIAKHGPKLRESGGAFADDIGEAAHGGLDQLGRFAKRQGLHIGKDALLAAGGVGAAGVGAYEGAKAAHDEPDDDDEVRFRRRGKRA